MNYYLGLIIYSYKPNEFDAYQLIRANSIEEAEDKLRKSCDSIGLKYESIDVLPTLM
jgi:hypothetical protein